MSELFVAIDIGGTFIKAAMVDGRQYAIFSKNKSSLPLSRLFKRVERIPAHFSERPDTVAFVHVLNQLVSKLNPGKKALAGIGISCTGIVNYHGTAIEKTTEALGVLKGSNWRALLESFHACPVVLVNDSDAATIGMAELGYLQGASTVGIMIIGTGLGFTIWRNGRRWRPGGKLPLLGSIATPAGSFNELVSASKMWQEREMYFRRLASCMTTATILYGLDAVFVSGGLVEGALAEGLDIGACLQPYLQSPPPELDKQVSTKIIPEGNLLQLLGALSLIVGETVAQRGKKVPAYSDIRTETPYDKDLRLHRFAASELAALLLNAENDAGHGLLESIPAIAQTAEIIADSLQKGGRLLYVGAGTSGRIAAMDAVEIPCTYGWPKDRVIALIAGGVADAALGIESNFEEDASSIPEVLLLNIGEKDVVIGISASGSAWFVQSALAFAAARGAHTVMIQSAPPDDPLPFCDTAIPLYSGYEVVAGSTRMKAGTATKKVLNALTTTAMILNGKVTGPYMTGLACINQKLIARAQAILQELYQLSEEESMALLRAHEMDMRSVVDSLEGGLL